MSSNPGVTNIVLDVENVDPSRLSHVWGVLSRVGEGLALDGEEVGVRLYRWTDEDGDEEIVLDPIVDEGSDLP